MQENFENFNPPAVSDGHSSADDDCVEAEIVYEGGDKDKNRYFGNDGRSHGTDYADPEEIRSSTEKTVNRIRTMFRGLGGIMLVIGLVLAIGGIFLSSTVIGIILGIPMIIAGMVLIWLGITILGGGHSIIYKNTRK